MPCCPNRRSPRRARALPAVALTVLVVVGLAGCGGGSSASSTPCPPRADTRAAVGGKVTICAFDIHYDVKTITATAGPLTVTLLQKGSVAHTFKVEGTGFEIKVDGKKEATGTVTLTTGTYSFECTTPGHALAGMRGKIVVG